MRGFGVLLLLLFVCLFVFLLFFFGGDVCLFVVVRPEVIPCGRQDVKIGEQTNKHNVYHTGSPTFTSDLIKMCSDLALL